MKDYVKIIKNKLWKSCLFFLYVGDNFEILICAAVVIISHAK